MSEALLAQTEIDDRSGRFVNGSLAECLVPVMADTPELKDLGEIALVGVAPAIANAIFHATGTRLRHLPITPDRLATALETGPMT